MNSNFGYLDFSDNDFQGGFRGNMSGRGGMMANFGRGGNRSYNLSRMGSMSGGFGDFGGGPMNNMNMGFGNNGFNMMNIQQQMQRDMDEFDRMEFDQPIMNPIMGMEESYQVKPFGRGGGHTNTKPVNFGIKKPALTSVRGRRKLEGTNVNNSQAFGIKRIKMETEKKEKTDEINVKSNEATTSCKGLKLENDDSAKPEETTVNSNLGKSQSTTVFEMDNYPYPSKTPEEFISKELKLSHPTGWVNETAKKKGWPLQVKEGMRGLPNYPEFSYTLTIKDLITTGVAKKKKEAKNKAYHAMAIKFGEVFKLLSPQPGTNKEELDVQISKLIKPSQMNISNPLKRKVNTMTPSVPSVPPVSSGISANPSSVKENPEPVGVPVTSLINPATQTTPVKVDIPITVPEYSQQQISSIPGHPVVALGDTLRSLKFGSPVFSCVKEERMTKIGIYCRWMFTMRVTAIRGKEVKEFFGKASTKKGAKNQAAAAAYFALTNQSIIPGKAETAKMSTPNPPSPPEGRKITVIGSAVPLPVPRILTSSYTPYTQYQMYASPQAPSIHINPNFVQKLGTPLEAQPKASVTIHTHPLQNVSPVVPKVSQPPSKSSLIPDTKNKTCFALISTQKLVSTSTLLKGKSAKSVSDINTNLDESNKKDDKDESLDDCLNEFETFLSGLDKQENDEKEVENQDDKRSSEYEKTKRTESHPGDLHRKDNNSRHRSRSRDRYKRSTDHHERGRLSKY